MESSRRLTFTLKQRGADKAHDMAFDLLKQLPKGYRADLIVQAVYEYIMSREGIHMVREHNGVKILNLGKEASSSQATYQPNTPMAEEHQKLTSEQEYTSNPSDNGESADVCVTGDALDNAIAAWFTE